MCVQIHRVVATGPNSPENKGKLGIFSYYCQDNILIVFDTFSGPGTSPIGFVVEYHCIS